MNKWREEGGRMGRGIMEEDIGGKVGGQRRDRRTAGREEGRETSCQTSSTET